MSDPVPTLAYRLETHVSPSTPSHLVLCQIISEAIDEHFPDGKTKREIVAAFLRCQASRLDEYGND